jgi:apolipoprotein N-acyltransferase
VRAQGEGRVSSRFLRVFPFVLVVVPAGLAVPLAFRQPQAAELIYGAILAFHLSCGILLAVGRSRRRLAPRGGYLFVLCRAPELLFSLAAVFFLFSYIYATNANMDYVQRFMTSHGNLRLAPNSAQERLSACVRFLPLLALDAFWFTFVRLRRPVLARRAVGAGSAARTWALPLAILSAVLFALSFPSFVRVAGLPVLGYICLVPVLFCLSEVPLGWGIFYGTLTGVLQTMVTNYWLGTFNLLTLQFVSVVALVQYIPFMAAALPVLRRSRGAGFLVLPAAWTVFDWLRSLGFLGYPWGMLGVSQYPVIPMVQVAALTGVWGVTFVITLCNSVIAWYGSALLGKRRVGAAAAVTLAATLAVTLGWAGVRTIGETGRGTDGSAVSGAAVRLALVQQNDDPRKSDYRAVFDALRGLTERALKSDPDLVVWSETAFVPNIRRWSREDPAAHPYAALVRDFLAWQKGTGRWLLTGNDDYSLVAGTGGAEERFDYNGSVLFSPQGERVETYHKIHLVPFTEYFPFKKQLPGVHALLMNFDAYLWEPGNRRVVFRHPSFSFATPICFEDVFPNDVRLFVRSGAQVILNLSNDYWSLTEVEGMQHAANSVFRAVENDRPVARAAASGLTCLVDRRGRITARSPFYQENLLVVDVPLPPMRTTLYTAWGDWFPAALAAFLLILLGWSLVRPRLR